MVDLLSRRDHSTLELTAKLKKAGHTPEEIESALEDARLHKYLPDESVLATREAGRLARAGKSPSQIKSWLTKKGLPTKGLVIEESEDDSAYKTAMKAWARLVRTAARDVEKAAKKKALGVKKSSWSRPSGDGGVESQLKSRVIRLLISRGFSSSTAQKVFSRLLSENPP
jgi:SOS response regulatory protein OraA/RecX